MNELIEFIQTTGRTLSQMALYSPEHPSVKDTIKQSHTLLTQYLNQHKELSLSVFEEKLVANGQALENAGEAGVRPFIALLTKFDIHSLTFLPGITPQEMIPFFRLASRGEIRKSDKNVAAALKDQGCVHIEINMSKYAKIGEDEKIGGGEGSEKDGEKGLWDKITDLSLNHTLKLMISKLVHDPKERERIFSHVIGKVKKEIEDTIKKTTEEFTREKTRLTGERDRTEGVVGAVADGVVVVDESGKVIMMNEAAENLYDVKLKECVGKPLWEKAQEEQMVALARDLTIPKDRPVVKEVQVLAEHQTQKTLRASSATIQDVNGRIVGMVSVLSDVTKQKELNRLQGEFMANVTHELRTPIHALKLALGAILEGSAGDTTPEQNKMLSLAGKNVDRLSRLIDDLLDFSKIEAGKMTIHQQVIDIRPLISESVAGLTSWAQKNNVQINFDKPKEFPMAYADGDRFTQVLVNLVSNGIKYTPPGGRVDIRCKAGDNQRKNMVVIEVQDSGSGISKEDQKKIFDKFTQLNNSNKSDVRGTGLGLAICHAITDLHKGFLTVQSPPPGAQGGSLFSFGIPTADKGHSTQPSKPSGPAAVPQAPKKSFLGKIFSRFKLGMLIFCCIVATAQARPRWGNVRRVIKPDLIQLESGDKVRYLGLDVPEVGASHYPDSLAANKRLVYKQEVRLKYGLQERDNDGVWLAYVFSNGVLINEEMVNQGWALVSSLPNEEEYLGDLISAEKNAQSSKRGIWKTTKVDSYNVRKRSKKGFPWATVDELKKGVKE